jgi:hypothetical protein
MMVASVWTQYCETQIREILELSKMGMQPADLARRYDVPLVVIHVWQIKYGSSADQSEPSRLRRLELEISKLGELLGELTVEKDALEAKLGSNRE